MCEEVSLVNDMVISARTNEKKFILAIFFFSMAIRVWIGLFFKHMLVYPDCPVYYHMAESFAQGRGFRVFNYEYPYRILYSLLISPAFVFKDRYIQQTIVLLINCMLMSSTIFPYSLMAKRMIYSYRVRRLAYILFVICPDLHFTMTFMSENAFLPIATWTICVAMYYLWKRADDGKIKCYKIRISDSLCLGILFYMLYMTKKVGVMLAFIVECAIAVDTLCESIRNKNGKELVGRIIDQIMAVSIFAGLKYIGDKTWMYLGINGKSDTDVYISQLAKQFISKKNMLIVCTMIILIAFFVYLCRKNIIPESRIGATICGAFFLFTGIAFFGSINAQIKGWSYLIICIVIGSGVLPILFPAIFYTELREETKKLYLLIILMAVTGAALISWYDNQPIFDNNTLIVHFRYIIYLWLPIILCFCSLVEGYAKEMAIWNYVMFMISVVICALVFKGIKEWSTMDQTSLYYVVKFFDNRIIIYRVMLLILAVVIIPLFIKYKKYTLIAFFVSFFIIQLINNLLPIKYHYQCYYLSNDIYAEIYPLERKIEDDKGHNYMIIYEPRIFGDKQRIVDTFLNKANVYTVDWERTIRACAENGEVPLLSDSYVANQNATYDQLERADYLLLNTDTLLYPYYEETLTRLDGYCNSMWSVYKINDPYLFPPLGMQ